MLAELTVAAVWTIGGGSYSEEQVAAWAAFHTEPARFRARALAGALILVAVDDRDRSVAHAVLEPDDHLDQLYCHPDHSRRGLGDRLLAAAEQHARERGVVRLYTEASELARPAFERAGYAVTHRRDFTIACRNRRVPIHNYAMEKPLR